MSNYFDTSVKQQIKREGGKIQKPKNPIGIDLEIF
jgi:hypothetical protein